MGIETFLTVLLLAMAVTAIESRSPLVENVFIGGDDFEGPHYASDEGALYWVDRSQQAFYRLDVDTGNVTWREIGYGTVSLIVRVKDYPQLLLVTSRTELYFLSWNATEGDSSFRLLSAIDIGLPDNVCNDGKVDAKGRLWFGTMDKEKKGNNVAATIEKDKATLYMVTEHNHKNPEVKVRPVTISNGISWSADNKLMFYIDTITTNIDVFDFELDTGFIHNRRTVFSFQANNITGYPDGMTIDTDGNLWVACFGGGMVIKINPRTGRLLDRYKLPATSVTSVMWGGRDLSTLYVTTSTSGLTQEQLAQEPEAGSLFAIHYTGSKGFPQNQFVFANADKY